MLTKGNNLDLQLKVKQKWTDSITNDSNFKSTKEYLHARAWIHFRAPYKVIIRVQQLVLFAAKLALGDTITGHGMP